MYSLKRAGPLPEWLCPEQGDARRCDYSSRKGEGITDSSQNDSPGCLIMVFNAETARPPRNPNAGGLREAKGLLL